jgi:hypothetical protein
MLARVQAHFVFSWLLLALDLGLFLTNSLPLSAQVNGAPPSIASMGFGGRPINAIPPSVTSMDFGNKAILGGKGYGNNWSIFENCCSDFFFPAKRDLPLTAGHNRRHRRGDRGDFAVGVMEPVYVPYAAPYAPDGDGDDPGDVDAEADQAPGPWPVGKRPPHRISPPDAVTDETVTVQPSTVLVFKDGHQVDVVNYAIVGDTLFNFADGRTRKILLADLDLPATHKANDDRGVDFQIPMAAVKGQ